MIKLTRSDSARPSDSGWPTDSAINKHANKPWIRSTGKTNNAIPLAIYHLLSTQ